MKPRLSLAEAEAFARAKKLEWGKEVMIGEEKAIASGSLPGYVVFKIRNRLVSIPAGDPRLLTIVY